MLQANPTSSPFASTYAPPAPYGRPKRGTPDYAAAVRLQIARLAAMHAATIAEAAPSPMAAEKTVLLVAACPKVRDAVRNGLGQTSWVRLVEVESIDDARRQLAAEEPHLLLIDQPHAALLSSSAGRRTVLIADSVPRSEDMPRDLVGILARPLNCERVSRHLLALLEQNA